MMFLRVHQRCTTCGGDERAFDGIGKETRLSAGLCRVLPVLLLFSPLLAHAAKAGTNPPPADLTELPLEALMEMEVPKVYGASKFEQKATEAPSSITVVTSAEIERYGHRTLGDMLESLPGLYVSFDRKFVF